MDSEEFKLTVIRQLAELQTEQKNTAHDVKGMSMKIDTFATRDDLREVKKDVSACLKEGDVAALRDDVKGLKSFRSVVQNSALASVVGLGAVLKFLGLQLGGAKL